MSYLQNLPEELLERILLLASPNPHLTPSNNPLNPLLVSSTFLRIGTPALHTALRLHSESQAQACAASLAARPAAAHAVRTLVTDGAFSALASLAALCPNLREVDVTLRALGDEADDKETPLAALGKLRQLRVLTLRKDEGAYLTHPRVARALSDLASVVELQPHLHTATLAFRLSPSPATRPLLSALSSRPALHTFRTLAPATWNTALLTLSSNPSLLSIALLAPGAFLPPLLSPATLVADSFAIAGSGVGSAACPFERDLPVADPDARTLFLREARKHDRLMSLIRTGTPKPRQRAHSLRPPSVHVPAERKPIVVSASSLLAPPPPHTTRLARSQSSSALA